MKQLSNALLFLSQSLVKLSNLLWFLFQFLVTNHADLTPEYPSSSLRTEKVSLMYQSGNKHENYENQVINGENNDLFQCKRLSKS